MLLLGPVHLRGCTCVCVCVDAHVWAGVRVCVCARAAMQSRGAGASLPDSRDLAALAVGHASARQEEVATALCHFPHPSSPRRPHLPPLRHSEHQPLADMIADYHLLLICLKIKVHMGVS